MLKVTILMVGKTKAGFIREGVAFYRRRLRPYLQLDLVELPTGREAKGLDPRQIQAREGQLLLAKVPPRAYLTALDPRGREYTSEEFAAWLARREEAARPLAILLGGHLGLSSQIRRQAQELLALSRFTLTHELSRLLLLEQLYRAMTIRAGHPYHV